MASPQDVYVNEAQGWSIVVPPGWEVAEYPGGVLTRDGAVAEIFVTPSSGLSLEQLAAQKVDFLRTWPGADGVEARTVQLPAGEAVALRLMIGSIGPNAEPSIFVLYVIEEGERQYSISVRGAQADADLLADAEALAESFAITDGSASAPPS